MYNLQLFYAATLREEKISFIVLNLNARVHET